MKTSITELFDKSIQNNINFSSYEINLIKQTIKQLNKGKLRIAEKNEDGWIVNDWVKKAILLYFKINNNYPIHCAPQNTFWYDKIDNKFSKWEEEDYYNNKIRTVPLSYVRYGSYIASHVVLMPSFVNIGAYIDSNTMIDSWVTVGSCAQIGKNCHISANVCIGGVLEPLQAAPVIIEDNCFIGAGSQILEGIIIKENSVIAAGTILSGSTKIINRATQEIIHGVIPSGSVIVPGSYASSNNTLLNCAVIIKTVDKQIKNKTSINELLRE